MGTKFTGGIGRKAMAKQHKAPGDKGRWPVKATLVIKDILSNAIVNAESKGMNVDKLYISHAQVNRAPPGRRRVPCARSYWKVCQSTSSCRIGPFGEVRRRREGRRRRW